MLILLQTIIQACAHTLSNPDGETENEPWVKTSVVTKTLPMTDNDSLNNLHDLNAHLNIETSVIMEDFVQRFSNKTPKPIFFEWLHNVTLSRSQNRVTSFIDFSPYKYTFPSLIKYADGLKRNLYHYASIIRYSSVKSSQPMTYEENSRTQSFHRIIAECIEEVKMISTSIINSQSQFIRILDLISDGNPRADAQELWRSKLSVLWLYPQMAFQRIRKYWWECPTTQRQCGHTLVK